MEQFIAYLNLFLNTVDAYQVSLGLNLYVIFGIGIFVISLTTGYFRNYHLPAIWLRSELITIIRKIKLERLEEGVSEKLLKSKLDKLFAKSPFKNIWLEFCQSLHVTYEYNRKENIKEIFATVPSATFFSKDTLIDIQINRVFYRNLPSLLIGFSAIIALTAIIWGLYQFSFGGIIAAETLPAILQEVTSAFIGSGLAIIAAVFISYKEKAILNKAYMVVDELNKELDSLYLMGVHEEYLSRIVKFSEGAPNAINEIKDDLVVNLIDINERQIEAQKNQNEAIATQVAFAVKDALLEPMMEITAVLREVRGDQRKALGETLGTLVEGFMSEVKSVVGDQIQEVNNSIKASSEVLNSVRDSVEKSAENISKASVSVITSISSGVETSFDRMLKSQEKINAQMREDQIQVSEAMDDSMKSVVSSIADSVVSLAIERKQQIKQDEERNTNLITSMDKVYTDLSFNVEELAQGLKTATFKTAENFENIQQVTINLLSKMQEGAKAVDKASGKFSEAGDKMVNVTKTISETSSIMEITALSVKESFEEYDRSRSIVKEQVDQFHAMIDIIKDESGIKKNLVEDMERIVKSLETAEIHSTEYLESINTVLKGSFEDFGSEMVNQVRNISAESNRHLGSSLEVLSGTVESMVDSVTKLRRAA